MAKRSYQITVTLSGDEFGTVTVLEALVDGALKEAVRRIATTLGKRIRVMNVGYSEVGGSGDEDW